MQTGNQRTTTRVLDQAQIDAGLRSYMLRVYNYMMLAIAMTGGAALAVAYGINTSEAFANLLLGTPLKWVIMLAPLGMVIFLSARIHKMSLGAAQASFWTFALVMGVGLAPIFLIYTGSSIARVFFITSGAFAGLSLFGYLTKRDLSAMGTFLMMGLIGLIIAMVVNIFMQSAAMQFAISGIGVLIFSGLTAYDTQNIRRMYVEGEHDSVQGRKAIHGALRLYLDFINLFLFLLQIFGGRN